MAALALLALELARTRGGITPRIAGGIRELELLPALEGARKLKEITYIHAEGNLAKSVTVE